MRSVTTEHMSLYRVARRYADAASELAEEQHQSEQLAKDLDLVGSWLKGSRELQAFLKSPVIPREKKLTVMSEIFRSRVSPFTFNFLTLLLEKGREDVLGDIVQEYLRLRDERLGIVTLDVHTATELTTEQQGVIVKRFESITKKKIRVSFSVEKELKGGIVARVGDTVYDGSIRRQLELLRERFAEAGSN